ncbi:MAG: ABC transporter ATP-binding protein [Acidobacteria bacterium]|nr:ABC transporter ATP-binding protein [Acidobacteriota bacterium]
MDPGGESGIRAVGLAKRYRSGAGVLTVFENLDLEVSPGERLALVGESGAGKSTLLHLIGGLDRPSHGKIYVGDKDLTSLGEHELADFRNREIGFVWQTHYLLPEFSALENVMMPLLIRGVAQQEVARAARERLEEVGLAARVTHRAGELSGGEQQRVVLARALAGNPGVLLADEPTGNLDYRTGERIADLLDEIHARNRLTSVFVTHNLGFAKRCSRILKLERGMLVPVRDEHEYFESPSTAPLQADGETADTASRSDGI